MFYPTKPGSEEFGDVSYFIKKLSYSIYHRLEHIERRREGLAPRQFKITPINLDRFVKRDSEEFSIEGSNPPESLDAESEQD